MDLAAKKILLGVAIKSGENSDRLRNKGSPVKLNWIMESAYSYA